MLVFLLLARVAIIEDPTSYSLFVPFDFGFSCVWGVRKFIGGRKVGTLT
jgi:hypothetical protein